MGGGSLCWPQIQYGLVKVVIPAKAGIQRRLFRGDVPGFPPSREWRNHRSVRLSELYWPQPM